MVFCQFLSEMRQRVWHSWHSKISFVISNHKPDRTVSTEAAVEFSTATPSTEGTVEISTVTWSIFPSTKVAVEILQYRLATGLNRVSNRAKSETLWFCYCPLPPPTVPYSWIYSPPPTYPNLNQQTFLLQQQWQMEMIDRFIESLTKSVKTLIQILIKTLTNNNSNFPTPSPPPPEIHYSTRSVSSNASLGIPTINLTTNNIPPLPNTVIP